MLTFGFLSQWAAHNFACNFPFGNPPFCIIVNKDGLIDTFGDPFKYLFAQGSMI